MTVRTSRGLRLLVAVLAILGWQLVVAIPSALAATITVNTTADALVDDAFCSLREAVISANTNSNAHEDNCTAGSSASTDFIQLGFSTTYQLTLSAASNEDAAATGDLDLTDDVQFTNTTPSTTIDASTLSPRERVFHVPSDALVTFPFMTITGGLTTGAGGGVLIDDGTVTLDGTTVTGNTAATGGGVANDFDGSLIFDAPSSGTISANVATASGGGIWSDSTALLEVADAIISGNMAGTRGGGISSSGAGGLTINEDTIVRMNTAVTNGGGVSSQNGDLTVTDSTFENNTVTAGAGGGIDHVDEPFAITATTFSQNSAVAGGGLAVNQATGDVSDSTLEGNMAADGAGIHNTNGTVTVIASTLDANEASDDGGGAFSTGGPLTLRTSTVVANTAVGDGGGVRNEDDLTVQNSTLSANEAGSEGGGIYDDSMGTVAIVNSTIAGNQAGPATGGGILTTAGTPPDIRNVIVAGNAPDDCDGTLMSANFNLDSDGSCAFTGADDQSGVDPMLAPLADNGGPTETHALQPGSPAIDTGAAMCPANDQRGEGRPADGDAIPGALCDTGAFELDPGFAVDTVTDEVNGNGSCSLREAIIAANTDAVSGACPAGSGPDTIALQANATYELTLKTTDEDAAATGDLDITDDLTIVGNGATVDASPLGEDPSPDPDRVFDILEGLTPPTVVLDPMTITGGAEDRGGGIQIAQGSDVVVRAVVVEGNTADGDGGGIFNEGALTIEGSTIRDNVNTGSDGGGLWTSGPMVVRDSLIDNNDTDAVGGGLYSEGSNPDLYPFLTVELERTTVSGNTSSYGGGIYLSHDDLLLVDSTVIGNTATFSGGGILNDDNDVTVVTSTISGNMASDGGGIDNEGDTITIENSTISGNTATDDGGGIDNGGDLEIESSTITGNSAGPSTGGGINQVSSNDAAVISRTIVAANTPDDCAGQTVASGGHNLDGDGSCDLDQGTDKPGTAPLLDPLAANGGPTQTHALQPTSPAIDGGPATGCPATDQRGEPRPTDGDLDGTAECDIGAFERAAPAASAKSVSLTAKPKKVHKGKKATLTATVSPCLGHEGDMIEFQSLKGGVFTTFATVASDQACTAKVKKKMKKKTSFRARSAVQDADHLEGISSTVKVKVRKD